MTDNLDQSKIRWLTYLVYILLVFLTILAGWNTSKLACLPDDYVRLERYQADTKREFDRYQVDRERTRLKLNDIDSKLDRLIERGL